MKYFIVIFLNLILVCSCSKNFLEDELLRCLNSIEIPNNKVLNKTIPYLSGVLNTDSLNIFHGDGDHFFELNNYWVTYSNPGQWINPTDTAMVSQKGITFRFSSNDLHRVIELYTPAYEKHTSNIEIIDNIGKLKTLKIGDSANKIEDGYTFQWSYKCDPKNEDYLVISTGFSWVDRYYFDQNKKWIKIIKFEKIKIANYWKYEIVFNIDINLFTQKGYFGEFKGVFKTNFNLPING